MTVGDVPFHYASLPTWRDRVCLTADEGTRTWGELAERAARVANALRDLGLKPGDRVATLLPNCLDYVEIMYGIATSGCVIVPLSSRYVEREVAFAVDFTEASIVITSPDLEHLVSSELPRWVVGGAADMSYATALDRAASTRPDTRLSDRDLYWLPFTSGTTASPKAAMVSHRALVEHWHIVQRAFEITPRDRMLIAGPFYHSLGFLFGLTGLFAGGHVTIHRVFDPKRVLASIAEERITLTPMVPTMYTMILAENVAVFDVSSMRAVISAGSPLLTDTRDRLLAAFPDAGLYEFYGSTEVGIVSVLGPEDQHRKHRSVGLPPMGVRFRVVDDKRKPVPPGTPGEVEKRGLLLGGAYYRNDDATAEMNNGEWARTGDIGVIDDEGYLSIVDRKKDMIVTGGVNVFPAEIEEVIASHPGVLEVAVIGVPDDRWGEVVKAVIVTRPGATVTDVEILDICACELAGFKRPRSVDFVDALPKTGSGKILKRQIREQYWAGESVQVH